jgi:hypothetical protein
MHSVAETMHYLIEAGIDAIGQPNYVMPRKLEYELPMGDERNQSVKSTLDLNTHKLEIPKRGPVRIHQVDYEVNVHTGYQVKGKRC